MFFQKSKNLQEKFNDLKIFKSEKVALFSKNSQNYLKLLISLLIHGAVVVPLNPNYPFTKIKEYLLNINCNKLIIETNDKYNNLKEKDFYNLDFIDRLITFEDFKDNLQRITIQQLILNLKSLDFNDIINNDASIIFSSGSTGNSKAVLHTIGNHYYNALGSNYNIKLNNNDRWLISLPLNHVSGFSTIFKCALSGAETKVKEKDLSIIESIKSNNITHISLIPSQLSEIIKTNENIKVLKKLKAILIGGAPMPYFLVEEAFNLKLPIYISYGSTEMSSQITCTLENDSLKHLKSSGKLLKFRELKINNENEILVKGKTLFKGYITKDNNGKEILIKPFDENGWFKSGDLGFIDDENYLHILGRKDLMFFYKGEKIYPEEIENTLKEIGIIKDALVINIEDDEFSNIIVAFIKINDSNDLKNISFEDITKNIEKFLSNKIEFYKIPKLFLKWPLQENNQNFLKPDRVEFKKLAIKILKNKV